MLMVYVPSMPELVRSAIRQLTPYTSSEAEWKLQAAGCTDSLFCWKMQSQSGIDKLEVIIGIPTPVVMLVLPKLDAQSVRELWDAPDAYMTDLEELSRSLAVGTHRLVIAPVQAEGFGEITVTALYLQTNPS